MKPILVNADDLTGAAEIAAGAVATGLSARIVRLDGEWLGADVVAMNTDTRDVDPEAAARLVREVCQRVESSAFEFIYKKTDSILRGPVRRELEAASAGLRMSRVVLVPQNPSRGRTVRDGVYRIGDVELHQTESGGAHAWTSLVKELVGAAQFDNAAIDTPDAASQNEIDAIANRVASDELPAGGIDFFGALLRRRSGRTARAFPLWRLPSGPRLLVCGTRSESRRRLAELAKRAGVPAVTMSASNPSGDAQACAEHLNAVERCVLMSPEPVECETMHARVIEQHLADTVEGVSRLARLAVVLVEGGAVASAVLKASSRSAALEVLGEIAPGAVALRASTNKEDARRPTIVVKPGSYGWPASVFDD